MQQIKKRIDDLSRYVGTYTKTLGYIGHIIYSIVTYNVSLCDNNENNTTAKVRNPCRD